MRLVAESPTDWDVASWRALAECDSLERRRVPRTFWGSNEPRADAVALWPAMHPYLIQMGVWCASVTDAQPRERKTGCAWTGDRESSDASTRRRFRTPLDRGPVNGCPYMDPSPLASTPFFGDEVRLLTYIRPPPTIATSAEAVSGPIPRNCSMRLTASFSRASAAISRSRSWTRSSSPCRSR
jgi:hypothetical protein